MESHCIEVHSMRQILECFCFFLDKYEHCEWMRGVTRSEIQEAFQCAQEIENICSVLETKGCVTAFENKLIEWHKIKYGITAHYKVQEFTAACDLILSNFFITSRVTDEVLISATNEYLHICGRDRFHLLKEKLICKKHTHDAVTSVIDELNTTFLLQKYKSALGCELLKSIWTKYVRCGEKSNISNCIRSACTDSRFLDSVLRILVKEDYNEEVKIMKKIITESLVLKMSIENERDPVFWHAVLVTSRSLIVAVCDLYPEILFVLIKFIVYIGKSMIIEFTERNCIWHLDKSAKLIADLSFDDLVNVVRCFLESWGLAGNYMRRTLQDLKSQPGCSVWVEVERQCGLPVLAKCLVSNSKDKKLTPT
ncbi:hypothetical protein B7P43_G00407 [Cryptotermes secundus]|uniref:Uncharacterized protein n=1 Tax=Cryptotermes secundus TaxID=105785 RepID=A0A2J7R8W7_9NEOP|nr:uncharacterized protein LOC111862702 isoform X1 [Cryptotermes secundus]PNF37271.1 hypothetical protein B7P43_G00407 [Cryptotermes secundus]